MPDIGQPEEIGTKQILRPDPPLLCGRSFWHASRGLHHRLEDKKTYRAGKSGSNVFPIFDSLFKAVTHDPKSPRRSDQSGSNNQYIKYFFPNRIGSTICLILLAFIAILFDRIQELHFLAISHGGILQFIQLTGITWYDK